MPPAPIRELRDLTRGRTAVTRERSRQDHRFEELLKDTAITRLTGWLRIAAGLRHPARKSGRPITFRATE